MGEWDFKTERELYEEWKPLLEAQREAITAYDYRQDAEQNLWIEQTNYSIGVDAEGHFPTLRHVHTPAVQLAIEEINGDDEC